VNSKTALHAYTVDQTKAFRHAFSFAAVQGASVQSFKPGLKTAEVSLSRSLYLKHRRVEGTAL
jgi:hypothetical protein